MGVFDDIIDKVGKVTRGTEEGSEKSDPDDTGSEGSRRDKETSPNDDGFDNLKLPSYIEEFSDKTVRNRFVMKVFLILLSQFILVMAVVAGFVFNKPVQVWIDEQKWVYYVVAGVFIVVYVGLVLFPQTRRKHPAWNIGGLFLLSLVFSLSLGAATCKFENAVAFLSVGVVVLTCLVIGIFAAQTRFAYTFVSGLLLVIFTSLLAVGGVAAVVNFTFGSDLIGTYLSYTVGGVVFSLILIIDIHLMMVGLANTLQPEDYVFGALNLFLDSIFFLVIVIKIFHKNKVEKDDLEDAKARDPKDRAKIVAKFCWSEAKEDANEG